MSMAEMTSKNQRQRFMMVGGSIGAILAFVATGMIEDVFKLIIGAALGVAIAMMVWAFVARTARERAAEDMLDLTKAELERRAKRANVSNTSSMTKAELAEAIVAKSDDTDPAGELMIETVGAVRDKVGETMGQAKEKLENRNTKSQ